MSGGGIVLSPDGWVVVVVDYIVESGVLGSRYRPEGHTV